MRGGVRIEGRERLNKKFKEMPEVIKARLRKVMERSANEIVRDMKRLAPRDTGYGADDIQWTWGAAPKGSVAIFQGEAVAGSLRITIYAAQDHAFYMRFHEFGTRNMPARPFFFPAYRSNRQRASTRIKNTIRRAAKDVMAGKLGIGGDE